MLNEAFAIPIGDIDTDVSNFGTGVKNLLELFEIGGRYSRTDTDMILDTWIVIQKGSPVLNGIMFVDGDKHLRWCQCLGYLECSSSVHIGGNDWNTTILVRRMFEMIFSDQSLTQNFCLTLGLCSREKL